MILAVLQVVIVGLAAARWIDPAMAWRRMLGTAYLLGSGICAFVLLGMSLLGIRWTAVSFSVALCVVAAVLWIPLLRRMGSFAVYAAQDDRRALFIDAATVLLIVAHGAYALKVGPREWDFWAIWGLKAKVSYLHGGFDWAYLAHPDHAFSHPDYPPLLPLNFVQIALMDGAWNDAAYGLLSTFFAAVLLLMVRDFFAEEFPRADLAAAATLAVASCSFSRAGLADAPLIAYGTAGLLLIRRGSVRAGAVILGLAAFTKNEGLALIAAAAIALLLTPKRKAVLQLWPAALVAAPWLLVRATHTLPSYLASGNVTERATNVFARIPELARALADHPPSTPLLWIAIAVALIACARELHHERFLLTALVIQLFFYLGAYLVTPYQLYPHVGTSWPRIVQHLALPAAFAALALVTRAASSSQPQPR